MNAKVITSMVLISGLLAGCASTDVPSFRDDSATHTSAKDERILWKEAKDLERRFAAYEIYYNDPEVRRYLQGIVDHLVSGVENLPEPGPEVHLVNTTTRNAFALPHGALFFNIGLLESIQSEAEFATIAGHELIHYINRHAIQESRFHSSRELWSSIGEVIVVMMGAALAGETGANAARNLSQSMTRTWNMAAISGYSQDLEWEADQQGLQLMIESGYDGSAAPLIFERLKVDAGGDEVAVKQTTYYSSHPNMRERQEHYHTIVEEMDFSNSRLGRRTTEYLENTGDLSKQVVRLHIDNENYAQAEQVLSRFRQRIPNDGDALYLQAQLTRLTGASSEEQILSYEKAASSPDATADAWKELGLAYRADGDFENASHAFSNYLQLVPDAIEAPLFETYIKQKFTSGAEH